MPGELEAIGINAYVDGLASGFPFDDSANIGELIRTRIHDITATHNSNNQLGAAISDLIHDVVALAPNPANSVTGSVTELIHDVVTLPPNTANPIGEPITDLIHDVITFPPNTDNSVSAAI